MVISDCKREGYLMDEKLYTVAEVADRFRVSSQAVYDWINRGDLRAIRIGTRIRIPESAMRELVRPIVPGELNDREDTPGQWIPVLAAA
jgi:excisionase family DNA binding protein